MMTKLNTLIFTCLLSSAVIAESVQEKIDNHATSSTLQNQGNLGSTDSSKLAPQPIIGLQSSMIEKKDSLTPGQIDSFLAFLCGEEKYEEWTQERHKREWSQYKKNLTQQWKHFFVSNFQYMLQWASTEVHPHLPQSYNVFYPFSGPDALHLVALYPHASNYVMIGQESIGSLENLYRDCKNHQFMAQRLTRINAGINSLIVRSFFVTADMAYQVSRANIGVVPLAAIQLRLMGYTVTSIEYVTPRYAKISFNKLGKESTIHYFSTDLTNAGLAQANVIENEKLKTLLDTTKPFYGFVKSASYLMHNPQFETVRKRLLDDAVMVVQDDSGIPYRSFINHPQEGSKWVAYPYGQYTKPFGTFSDIKAYHQGDLQKVFASSAKYLPFRLGYGYSRAPSNVVIYKKEDKNYVDSTPQIATVISK